jgi:hypothetical protein
MRFLTPAEVARLADAIGPSHRALVRLGAYGGLRIGELAGLRRRRVDLLRGTVDVAEIVVEVRGLVQVSKTRRARSIPALIVQPHLSACAGDLAGPWPAQQRPAHGSTGTQRWPSSSAPVSAECGSQRQQM